MTTAHRVLHDCDPGIDDALALMLAAASPEIDLTAVTVSYGNVGLGQAVRNALAVVDFVGRDWPVYAGADRPLVAPTWTWRSRWTPTGSSSC